jgi:hypothetical protein
VPLSFLIFFDIIGAIIAGAIRISAATFSGALKYVLTATREPAECLRAQYIILVFLLITSMLLHSW